PAHAGGEDRDDHEEREGPNEKSHGVIISRSDTGDERRVTPADEGGPCVSASRSTDPRATDASGSGRAAPSSPRGRCATRSSRDRGWSGPDVRSAPAAGR